MSAAHVGAAILSVMALLMIRSPAYADDVSQTSCIGSWTNFNCTAAWGAAVNPYVRLVPEPVNAAGQARAAARDREWLTRCHPVVEHDRYGVARYYYSAPNCEFGVGGN